MGRSAEFGDIDKPSWKNGPDVKGQSEKYIASLDKKDKKRFLIDEIFQTSTSLSKVSFDFEQNIDFYRQAPDAEVKDRLVALFFPHEPRKETLQEKIIREQKEQESGEITKPNPLSYRGSSEQWRRRVLLGIETFLRERQKMKVLEDHWNDPDKKIREQFRSDVVYGLEMKYEPQAIFHPIAMVVGLHTEDYQKILQYHKLIVPDGVINMGQAINKHGVLPSLDGKTIFIQLYDNIQQKEIDSFIRHELFHIYFNLFLRAKNISKVKEHFNPETHPQTLEEARVFIQNAETYYQSMMLEEAAAYLFNTTDRLDPLAAKSDEWEQVIIELTNNVGPNVDTKELQELIAQTREAQARYLKKIRQFQMALKIIIDDALAEKNSPLTRDELLRNLLFLISQWGPSRMDKILSAIDGDQTKIESKLNEFSTQCKKNLDDINRTLIFRKSDKKIRGKINSLSIQLEWLYPHECLPELIKLCIKLLHETDQSINLNSLLHSLKNMIIVRQEPLSQDEVRNLIKLERFLHERAERGTVRLHYKTLAKLIEEFSQKK